MHTQMAPRSGSRAAPSPHLAQSMDNAVSRLWRMVALSLCVVAGRERMGEHVGEHVGGGGRAAPAEVLPGAWRARLVIHVEGRLGGLREFLLAREDLGHARLIADDEHLLVEVGDEE